ncbi:MAG: FTR1 family protein [Gammaproteobacteria bacterium]|nr:FTR1 family protein [Gammaproteobacteria bacterium]
MLATALIVFREVLEAALLIGILMAATRGLAGRGRWLTAGIALGLAGAAALAGFAEPIAELAEGVGQELVNAGILLAATAMLAWHNLWMASHGREMAKAARNMGAALRDGSKPLAALMLAVALAVLREGAEVVLFLYGIQTSAGTAGMLSGGLLGLAAGSLLGWGMYAGLLRLPLQLLFRATAWLLMLLAAGLASQAAALLAQADLLPSLSPQVWDSSAWLPQHSAAGNLLHVLMGYEERPLGIQVLVYGLVAAGMGMGMAWQARRQAAR